MIAISSAVFLLAPVLVYQNVSFWELASQLALNVASPFMLNVFIPILRLL